MTCFIARNMLSELVDDALDSARQGELDSHLAGCEACSRELSEIRRTRQMLRALPMHKAPVDFLAKVREKAEQKSALERLSIALSPLLRPRIAGGIAVAASVMLGVTVLLENREQDLWTMGGAPAPRANLQLPKSDDANRETAKLASLEKETEGDQKAGEALLDDERSRQVAAAQAPADATIAGGDGFLEAKNDRFGEKRAKEQEYRPQPTATPAALANKFAATPAPTPNVPPPAKTTVALGRAENATTKGGGGSGEGASAGPDQAGLYYSTPAPGGASGRGGVAASTTTVAKDRGDADVARVPVSEPAIVTKSESSPEPAFDVTETGGSRRSRDAVKKEKAASGKVAAAPAPAEEREEEVAEMPVMAGATTASSGVESQDEVVSIQADKAATRAATPAAVVVQARLTSTNPMAPAKVLEIATSMGATAITKTPPSLGKAGVSTVVVVEMPAASVEAFREKLSSEGSFELLGSLPSGRTRLRIEVVRE